MSKLTNCAAGGRRPLENAANNDTLLKVTEILENINMTPDVFQKKLIFIFNNLSQTNLKIKCEEVKEIISEEYYQWLSEYLVTKRASFEHNFHVLFKNFLDILNIPELNRLVISETYRNIKKLLISNARRAKTFDRSMLINLGQWLGMLTLSRNQPILSKEIDLKALLLEAYHKGQKDLSYVIPFVTKMLGTCATSTVFKPPNPWTMSLVNILAELYQEPCLTPNLIFEIEVVFKKLRLNIVKLKPTFYLKDLEQQKKDEAGKTVEVKNDKKANVNIDKNYNYDKNNRNGNSKNNSTGNMKVKID